MFPCPNPTCTHTFAPNAVKGASSLVCPKCGTVFQFGPSPAPPPRPSSAAKKPTPPSTKPSKAPPPLPKTVAAPPPMPRPALPAVPIAQPVNAGNVAAVPSAALNFISQPELVVPRLRRPAARGSKRRLVGCIALTALGVVGLALVVWGGVWFFHFLRTNRSEPEEARTPDAYNSRFNRPDEPWKRDRDIKLGMQVHIGMASPEHNSGLGVFFKDYKDRLPSDAELLDVALGKLRSYLQGLEWELKPKEEQARLAGRAAQVLEFQGVGPEDVTMNGECYMTAYRGYGYWFFTWAPLGELAKDGEPIHAEWAQLRQRLSLLDGRKGWTARPRETEKIAGKKATYQLAYVKGLWTSEPAEDYDPQADLVLKGHEPDPDRKPLAGKDAVVQVLVLPKQPDLAAAVKAAREYVLQREKKLYERTTLETIRDKNGAEIDRAADVGAEHGHLSKLKMKNTEDLERYLLLAVVNRPEGVIAVVGECLWERHDFWDQELTVLLSTFKVKGR